MGTAVVLAAGRGTRLAPLTEEVPKPALPVLDVPLIVYALAPLVRAGLHVVINISHLGGEVRSVLSGWAGRADYEVLDEGPEPWGTGGTVAAVAALMRGDALLVRNSDLLSDTSAEDLLAAHEANEALATLAVTEVGSGADLIEAPDGTVAFVDRRQDARRAGLLYIGTCVLSRAAIDLIPQTKPAGLAETVFRPLAERGELAVHRHRGYSADVGTPGRYLAASLDLVHDRLTPPVELPGTVLEHAGGRAYVGPRVSAPPESLGPDAVVCAGATVDPGARVARAIVWPGERVPGGTTVEDAIWFRGATIAAG